MTPGQAIDATTDVAMCRPWWISHARPDSSSPGMRPSGSDGVEATFMAVGIDSGLTGVVEILSADGSLKARLETVRPETAK